MKKLLILLYMTPLFALAQNVIMTTPAIPAADTQADYCPVVKELVKEGLFWQAPGGWVSHGESFDSQATVFIRAEWIGINKGRIICLYKGDKKYGFPIALEQKLDKLAPSPSGYRWSKDLKGHKECISNDVKECPFHFEKTTQPGNIYESLDFYKGQKED